MTHEDRICENVSSGWYSNVQKTSAPESTVANQMLVEIRQYATAWLDTRVVSVLLTKGTCLLELHLDVFVVGPTLVRPRRPA